MARLFDRLMLRGLSVRNRIGVSPMCQYSAVDGRPTGWHTVHLGSRAVGGAGIVFVEATAVEARGRITPADAGLWNDALIEPWSHIAALIASHGAVPAMQLAHAGRKASTSPPWEGGRGLTVEQGAWTVIAPSAIRFADGFAAPRQMTSDDIHQVHAAFVDAARRSVDAGFRMLEIHSAHGYLLNEFLSPLANHRTDEYGGSFDNRIRLLVRIVRAVRGVVPADLPLSVRLSCTDWVEGGWTVDDSVALAQRLRAEGVDLIDCSSGGILPHAKVQIGPGYQVPFAEAIRSRAGIMTAAVGMITEPRQADEIIANGQADLVLLARAVLRDPYWAIRACRALGAASAAPVPVQYARAFT